MGHAHGPDGAHTHGGGGLGGLVLVVVGLVLLASIAGPVVAAVADLVRVVLITLAVVAGLAVLGGAGLVAWRLRRGRPNAPRVVGVVTPGLLRPSRAPPAPRHAIEYPRVVHLHFHGVTAEDVAAIIARVSRERE